MITIKKLRVFKKYKGDIDYWTRAGTKSDHNTLTDLEWSLIEQTLQDLRLVSNQLASSRFSDILQEKISLNFEPSEAIAYLQELSRTKV